MALAPTPKTARAIVIRGTLEYPPDPATTEVVITGTMDAAEPIPPEPPPADHAYFDQLVARPECKKNFSLRDPAQLATRADGGYAQNNSAPLTFTYDPAADLDPRRQDAAKGVIEARHQSCVNQVRLPLPDPGEASLLVTWDAWYGAEFRYQAAGISTYKTFQLDSPKDHIWTEIRSQFKGAPEAGRPEAVAAVDVRFYGTVGKQLGDGVSDEDPLSPQLAEFFIMPERWIRYWVFFEPAGEWRLFSLWVADEATDPIELHHQLPMKPNKPKGAARWHQFWLEYNTSDDTSAETRTDLVTYCRNVAMLVGVSDLGPLLARPMVGAGR